MVDRDEMGGMVGEKAQPWLIHAGDASINAFPRTCLGAGCGPSWRVSLLRQGLRPQCGSENGINKVEDSITELLYKAQAKGNAPPLTEDWYIHPYYSVFALSAQYMPRSLSPLAISLTLS
ncbi:MAG: hypothetical protein ACJ8BW_14240 [Ktedonobacteraceae bacterium]